MAVLDDADTDWRSAQSGALQRPARLVQTGTTGNRNVDLIVRGRTTNLVTGTTDVAATAVIAAVHTAFTTMHVPWD